ncbi:peptidoglycan DD-metalloendopeptidase family protein [Treponema sp. Marseille-Q3903]|uniref:peptidoglycan DD-metalloendopeptidase family protein n=1 Tax=Treponema sp. Marseille-Q3903 TaxID=2766703 RepID=UPI001652B1C9|nr:M23 family metallopeptidase [Treponema sp. Marseille-Q3903]MBC6714015.1 M23 family metallopeptidase [Treponema sp. Marseille-Q3903]
MEIISYVQGNAPGRKVGFSLPVFERIPKRERTKSVSIVSPDYSTELKIFKAQKIKRPFSLKNCLKAVGSAVSAAEEFIFSNSKSILFSLIAAAATFLFFTGGFLFVSNQKNYTGPLTLESGDSLDIENLNKLMSSFALEGIVDYDESGKINDSDITSAAQKFTQPVSYQNYKVLRGDTIGGIAIKFGLTNISTLISVNDIVNVRQLAAGQRLKIPSIDGIIYTVKNGDSLNSIASRYKIKLSDLLDVNEISSEILVKGQQLFLPGVGMDQSALKNAMGDIFKLPVASKFRWTSPYGWRIDPIANVRSFHTGVDMACPSGTPVLAAMSGKVITTGVSRVYGNYVIIDHGNGYQTLYAHLSKIIAVKGQWVSQGTRIGLVGSTGYSTGPHLHFTVYKKGQLINPMTVLK